MFCSKPVYGCGLVDVVINMCGCGISIQLVSMGVFPMCMCYIGGRADGQDGGRHFLTLPRGQPSFRHGTPGNRADCQSETHLL